MKYDNEWFQIYKPCDKCIYKHVHYNWCNILDIKLLGDMENCKHFKSEQLSK